jgi:alkylation response protein AidB-like acyl-CoA dehydrogenase
MKFGFSEEQLRFREEVRDFCLKTPRYKLANPMEESFYSPEYYRDVAAKGWIGLQWPKQYGGQGRSWVETALFNEEMGYHRAPLGDLYYQTVGLFGDFCCSYGTERQKKDYLPRIARGEIKVARGYTEPNAGYDLASMETYARPDGDDYIINGHKRFITGANVADHVFLMARTDPDAPKEKGISFFVVDLKTPGISVSPVWTIALRTNDVFFDNVRVPGENMVGEKNRAFEYIDKDPHFRYETSLGLALGDTRRTFERFVRYVKEEDKRLSQSPQVRQKLAEIATEIEILRLMTYRVAWMRSAGLSPKYEIYMEKFCEAETSQKLTSIAMEILGLFGQLEIGSKHAPLRGIMPIYSRTALISFLPGSPEILRNAIAQKALGLPA